MAKYLDLSGLQYFWQKIKDSFANILDMNRVRRDFGEYSNPVEVTLSQSISGKYVNTSGQEVSAAGYGISAPISLAAGDILLVPSASAVLAECSVVSRMINRTYDKVISYIYSGQDAQGRTTTATDADRNIVYTAHYPDNETTVPDYWTTSGDTQVETLPSTYEVTQSFFEPLVKQSVAAMPSLGYYVYLSDVTQTVVISAFTATVNGGKCIKAGWGVYKNIVSNFVGHSASSVVSAAICVLMSRVKSLEKEQDNLGNAQALSVNTIYGYNIQSAPTVLYGAGAPSVSVVPGNWDVEKMGEWTGRPCFIGQIYIDTTATNGALWVGKDCESVSSWATA